MIGPKVNHRAAGGRRLQTPEFPVLLVAAPLRTLETPRLVFRLNYTHEPSFPITFCNSKESKSGLPGHRRRMDGLGGSVGTSCSELLESRSRHCKGGAIDSQANPVESAYYRHQRFDPDRIREVRAYYLQFLAGHDFIVELGCGRGEFLELLKDWVKGRWGSIRTRVVAERSRGGLDVVLQDAVEFVETTGEAPTRCLQPIW